MFEHDPEHGGQVVDGFRVTPAVFCARSVAVTEDGTFYGLSVGQGTVTVTTASRRPPRARGRPGRAARGRPPGPGPLQPVTANTLTCASARTVTPHAHSLFIIGECTVTCHTCRLPTRNEAGSDSEAPGRPGRVRRRHKLKMP